MKKAARILFRITIPATIIMPLVVFLPPLLLKLTGYLPYQLANFLSKIIVNVSGVFETIFPDFYFSIMPGLLLIAAAFHYNERLSGQDKKSLEKIDLVWVGIAALSAIIFLVSYSADRDSIFFRIEYLFGFIPVLGELSPDLYTFAIWLSFITLLLSVIFIYRFISRTGLLDQQKFGALLLGIMMPLLFAILLIRVPMFAAIEEYFLANLFEINRNPGDEYHAQTGMNYCPIPYDDSGKKIAVRPPNPDGIRDDIQIVGISKETIEKVHGNWPLDWKIYADLTDRMSYARNNILLFDISFLDEKGVYGGNYCGVKFNCLPREGHRLERQVDVLSKSFSQAQNIVVSDFPMETTDEAKNSILNYETRLKALNKRSNMVKKVKNGHFGVAWAKLPLPPVESITNSLDGIAYANILKNRWGMNRMMPIVMRIINEEKAQESDYNPDEDDFYYPGIDLMIVAKYYGISIEDDVEVDWLQGYVKLKNIPRKTKTIVDMESFEQHEIDIMARPNDDRTITIPIDRWGLMNINFRGGRYCFKFHEILDITDLNGPDVGANFSDKIILVAMYYATGVGTAKDMHLSPYGDMAGIEHHAYSINTILNQDFAYTVPPWANLAILMVIGLIMGLYLPRVSTGMNFLFLIIIALLFIMASGMISFKQYSLLHVLPTVLVQQFVIAISFIGFRALTEEENVKFIRNTFSKFVSQDVVDELLSNPEAIALGGAKKEVSVFFSDVRGFTTISEELGPEELVKLLNEYLTVMTELIIDYRGTIDKYMGDAIMAFWGAPVKNDDHAYYTCVAAIAQLEALKELQVEWSNRNIPVLDIGIGINSGQAVVGNMGSSHRMDYTLMGDTVNLGSRLEGITKTYGVKIVMSEYTYEKVKDRVFARELDLVRVKGKLEPVRIYELMGLVDDSDINKLKRSGHTAGTNL